MDSELLGITKAGTVLTRKSPNAWSTSLQREIKLSEWKLNPMFSLVGEIVVRLPQRAEHVVAVLSPRGERMAWNIFYTRKLFQFSRARKFPFYRRRQSVQQSLWISQVDGTRMRKLGDFEPSSIVEVSWTPEGEHLEFLWQNAIYLVPVK